MTRLFHALRVAWRCFVRGFCAALIDPAWHVHVVSVAENWTREELACYVQMGYRHACELEADADDVRAEMGSEIFRQAEREGRGE